MVEGSKDKTKNPMRDLRIRKLCLNICVGESGDRLTRAGKVQDITVMSSSPSLQATLPDPFPGSGQCQNIHSPEADYLHLRKHGCTIADHVPKSSATLIITQTFLIMVMLEFPDLCIQAGSPTGPAFSSTLAPYGKPYPGGGT